MKVEQDHFYKQFDRYSEGQERFEAIAGHAAMLLNSMYEKEETEKENLIKIRNALIEGVNPVKIALAIQERLVGDFETNADGPSLGDLAA